jgi:hypothetical protein
MAINKNHEFEELDGIKCAIVERNASHTRIAFLKKLLEHNGYTVVIQAAPPLKPPAAPAVETAAEEVPVPPVSELFTIGVTDVMFNATNAIFGRLLRTPDRHVVTLAYWKQQETASSDQVPYYENRF